VRQHDAFRVAGGAGGIDQRGHIVGDGLVDQLVEFLRMVVAAAQRHHLFERLDARILVGDARQRVEDDDVLDAGHFVLLVQHLVELVVVRDDDEARFGIADDVRALVRGVGGVDRGEDRADRLTGQVGDRPFGPVLGEDRNAFLPLEAQRQQAQRQIAHLFVDLAVRPRLPFAVALGSQEDFVAELGGAVAPHLGQIFFFAHASTPAARSSCQTGR